MPPRKKAKNAAPTRRSTRRTVIRDDSIPEVYAEMLAEAYEQNPADFEAPRPSKRRRTSPQPKTTQPRGEGVARPEILLSEKRNSEQASQTLIPTITLPANLDSAPEHIDPVIQQRQPQNVAFNAEGQPQTIYDDSLASSDSEADFEDVEIDRDVSPLSGNDTDTDKPQPQSVRIDLSKPLIGGRKTLQRRKPVTKAERQFRLDVHKWHLLCLLLHVATRNKWCNDEVSQATLKPVISRHLIGRLHREGTQAERKFAFDNAIEVICGLWHEAFTTLTAGMRRSRWREEVNLEQEVEDADDPIDFDDFRDAARSRSGSRDLGAQLFCTLLRAVALDARLVCSLQVLPLSAAAGSNGDTPKTRTPGYIMAGAQEFGTTKRGQTEDIAASQHPVWWVEVLNPAIDQWIPLDPVVRNTVNKPRTGFEPPSSDAFNATAYVIAFEEDGSARDVTKRYTSAYNAKTRKLRVESTKGGSEWFSAVMAFFSKPPEPRDQVEDVELQRRVAHEGMPKNVQDFKDHPIYVLERHLRSNEVIEPRRECGRFTVGKNQKVEGVFRRADVYACRSAEGWYRKGRDVKAGAQALKIVPKRRGLNPVDEGESDEGVALYADFQTDVYQPPPVHNGRVPRNGYGNLDVYVPSMIPMGGIHVRHPLAAQAARILGIDAVEAVVGFKFKGRTGTAVIDGVVVDAKYAAAMVATTAAVEDDEEEEVIARRSEIFDSMWRKMIATLRMRERIHAEYGDETEGKGEVDEDTWEAGGDVDDDEADDDESAYEDDSGGFVAETGEATIESRADEATKLAALRDRQPMHLPSPIVRQKVQITRSPHVDSTPVDDPDSLFDWTRSPKQGKLYNQINETSTTPFSGKPGPGGFGEGEEVAGGGFLADTEEQGGGFMAEDNGGGGFVPEDDGNETPPEPQSLSSEDHGTGEDHKVDQNICANLESSHTSETYKTQVNHLQVALPDDGDSVLSHDPDEEDADMQWVEDAFDEGM